MSDLVLADISMATYLNPLTLRRAQGERQDGEKIRCGTYAPQHLDRAGARRGSMFNCRAGRLSVERGIYKRHRIGAGAERILARALHRVCGNQVRL